METDEKKFEPIGFHVDFYHGIKSGHIRFRCMSCGMNWCEEK